MPITDATPDGSAPESLEDLIAGSLNDDGTIPEEEKKPNPPATDADENEDEDTLTDDEDPEGESEETEGEEDTQDEDEELSDDEEDPAAPVAPTVEDILPLKVPVKIDGVEQQVTVSEALAGYSRTQDYTKKTMALAEEKKEVAATKETYAGLVARMTEYLDTILVPDNKPDPALRESDPGEYAAQMQEWNALTAQRNAAQAEKDKLDAEQRVQQEQATQAQVAEFRKAQHEKVIAALPAWEDEKVAQREAKIIRAGALDMGFTDEDLGQLFYAPAILALRKAVLYDRQKAKAKTVARPVASKGTLKPGASKTQTSPKQGASKKAAARLKQSGSQEDFAAFLMTSGHLDD